MSFSAVYSLPPATSSHFQVAAIALDAHDANYAQVRGPPLAVL